MTEPMTFEVNKAIYRFMCRTKVAESGCVEWVSPINQNGYGHFKFRSKNYKSHKWIYEQTVGPIPHGLELDHLCRNKVCVNIKHLEPVTHRENVLRGTAPAAKQARQTHCLNGHEFNEENTNFRTKNKRRCRVCDRDKKRMLYKSQRDHHCGGAGVVEESTTM